jgi:hypothetical protein
MFEVPDGDGIVQGSPSPGLVQRRHNMFHGNGLSSRLVFALILSAAVVLSGCAAKKALWGDPQKGLILTYRMTEGQELQYASSSDFAQNLEISGQQMQVNSERTLSFSVKQKGMKGGNHVLGVTIDSMELTIDSPQGGLSPDMSGVVGKSFDMTLSSLGKEAGLSGAKQIKYSVGMQGERNIASEFEAVFPDLAAEPLKVGGTWTTRDTIRVEDGASKITITLKSLNTLVGYETVMGMECAKISSDVTGAMEGEGEQGGQPLVFGGEVTGDDTWYFAYKEGLFVKNASNGAVEGEITVGGPGGMVIPMQQTTKIETALVNPPPQPATD